jgi:hypothetical protein
MKMTMNNKTQSRGQNQRSSPRSIVVPDLAYRILKSCYLWISEQQIFAMQEIYLESSHQPLITMPHLNIVIIISAVPRFF